jgi:hypothetical protein
MNGFEIPLSGMPQRFRIALLGVTYQLNFQYRAAPMGGWVLDIADAAGVPLVCGIPLVTGHDLLEQYHYLNFGGALMVFSDGDPDAVPSFENLGSSSHLVWITP